MRANTVPDDYMKQGFSEAHQYVFAALIDSMQAQGRHRDALETAERARSRAFLDLLATRRDHGGDARAAATSTAPGAAPDLPVAQPAPLDSSRSSPPATVDDIVGVARRLRSTFLCYWVGAASTSIWAIAPDGRIVSKTVAIPAAKLVALVAEATGDDDETRADEGAGITTGATRSDVIGSGGSARRPWRELYRLLIEPVRSALPSAPGSRLTIVPHGPLLRLSFAGLRDASGRYLIESHDLHYVPAAAVLAFTKRVRSPGKGGSDADVSRTNGGSLLVGDPGELAGDTGGAMLNALPWARREVEAVRRVVSQPATVLVGEQAGEGAVRRALAHRSLLHLATHGIVRSEETLTSYLALRPDGETADGDGRLTADEVYALSIEADLVVLSACRSALGPTTGDGVIGFTRAFLSAGAASVVATMWDVPDRTTYEVMRRFHLRRAAGAGKSRSLRVSQLAVLTALREGRIRIDGTTLPETPRLWAGFVLVGEP
jgi:CHAT domain-containing protein